MNNKQHPRWQLIGSANIKEATPYSSKERYQTSLNKVFSPTKHRVQTSKLFSSVVKAGDRFSANQARSSIEEHLNTSFTQQDDYQIRNKLPSFNKLHSNKKKQPISSNVPNSRPSNKMFFSLIQIETKKPQIEVQKETSKDESVIKPQEYSVLKALQQQLKELKSWVLDSLRKQQQVILDLSTQILRALEQQPGRIRKNTIVKCQTPLKALLFPQPEFKSLQEVTESYKSQTPTVPFSFASCQNAEQMVSGKNQPNCMEFATPVEKPILKKEQLGKAPFNRSKSISYLKDSNGDSQGMLHFNRLFETMEKIKNQIDQIEPIKQVSGGISNNSLGGRHCPLNLGA